LSGLPPDYVLGNIKQPPFMEIVNGDRANRFRKSLNESEDGMFPGCLHYYQNMLFGKKIKDFCACGMNLAVP
jgi:hypothetical protein